MYVLLFDIDGTLIDTGGAGGKALLTAFADTFGVEKPERVQFSGRTDRGIVSELFRHHDVDASDDNWERLLNAYLRQLSVFLPLRQGRVLSGVDRLLSNLSQRDDVAVGLLTGNVRAGARIKLEHYGLNHYFDFGGFGDNYPNRDDVAREAWLDSSRHLQRELQSQRVWVIGDTPSDVTCARAINARSVAVATGLHSREELEELKPDLLLDSCEDGDRLIEQLC